MMYYGQIFSPQTVSPSRQSTEPSLHKRVCPIPSLVKKDRKRPWLIGFSLLGAWGGSRPSQDCQGGLGTPGSLS